MDVYRCSDTLCLSIISWTSMIRSVVIIVDSYARGEYAKVPSVPKAMLFGTTTFVCGILALGIFSAALCTRWRCAEGELKETTFWGP
jgi:hypothetical protein